MSQFDFKPLIIKILGSGRSKKRKEGTKMSSIQKEIKSKDLRFTMSSRKKKADYLPNLLRTTDQLKIQAT